MTHARQLQTPIMIDLNWPRDHDHNIMHLHSSSTFNLLTVTENGICTLQLELCV